MQQVMLQLNKEPSERLKGLQPRIDGQEHCKSITTQSAITLKEPVQPNEVVTEDEEPSNKVKPTTLEASTRRN